MPAVIKIAVSWIAVSYVRKALIAKGFAVTDIESGILETDASFQQVLDTVKTSNPEWDSHLVKLV